MISDSINKQSTSVLIKNAGALVVIYAMDWMHYLSNSNPMLFKVKIALGSKEVLGYKDYQGTGFVIEGTAKYLASGSEFDMMKEKFSFLTRVLEITITSAKQML